MKIGAEQLSNKITVPSQWMIDDGGRLKTYISSSGEMKMSLKLIICLESKFYILHVWWCLECPHSRV